MFLLDLVSYCGPSLVATILGPLPMLLAIPVAYRRARQGERVGLYMLVGGGFNLVATLTMAALLRGDALSLLKRADAAMYAGKQAGRNCLQRGGASAGLVAA